MAASDHLRPTAMLLGRVPRLPQPHAVRSCSVSRRGLVPFALAALLLVGCATGQRPYFADESVIPQTPTGDPAIDAVLERLESVDSTTNGPATAAYDVFRKYGELHTGSVVVLAPGKRSITVGNTHYIQTDDLAVTCSIEPAECVEGFDPQRISDSGVTYEFYAADTAKRLRRDALAKIGPATASTQTIAGQTATCVDVPVTGGFAVYCALDSGLLAELDDGDVTVTLTLYGETVDENNFVPPA
jgi:hypothetical protein